MGLILQFVGAKRCLLLKILQMKTDRNNEVIFSKFILSIKYNSSIYFNNMSIFLCFNIPIWI